jgi:hypothetical protein
MIDRLRVRRKALTTGLGARCPRPFASNRSDVVMAPGSQPSFWTLSSEPAGAVEAIGSLTFRCRDPNHFADTATAAWVAPQASANAGAMGACTSDVE